MRLGTVKVRSALPPGSGNITDRQIQEALWHYYYDVDKSVAYLVSTYLPKAQKSTKKIATKRDQGKQLAFPLLSVNG